MPRDAVVPRGAALVGWTLSMVLLVSSGSALSLASRQPIPVFTPDLADYPPLVIEGNAGFTGPNGVVGGSGTWYDPYRIGGWVINASAGVGISVRNTTAFFVIEDVRVIACTRYCVDLRSVTNGVVRDSYLETAVDRVLLNEAAGVRVWHGHNVAVVANTVTGPGYGVGILQSSAVAIEGNRLIGDPTYRPFEAVLVSGTTNATIHGNLLGEHGVGAFFYMSSEMNVSENRVWDDGTGLVFLRTANTTVYANHVALQGIGIRVELSQDMSIVRNAVTDIWGAYPDGRPVSLNRTVGARIYHNDFLSSGYPVDDMGPQNLWDGGYPTGGNWWGIEFAPDNCSGPSQDVCPAPDGIQDAPLPFDANSTDRYPFAEPVAHIDLPPIPSFFLTPTSGDTDTVFQANASGSRDLEHDWGLSYRWDWQDDGLWDTPWSTSSLSSHRFPNPGNFTIHLEVRDISDHTENMTSLLQVIQAPDRTLPALVHNPTLDATVGDRIPINVTATDSAGIANVTLYYSPVGGDAYVPVHMVALTPPTYIAAIPASSSPGIVRYYILAFDSAGNRARLPLEGTFNVSVSESAGLGSWGAYAVAALAIGAGTAIGALALFVHRRSLKPPPGNP